MQSGENNKKTVKKGRRNEKITQGQIWFSGYFLEGKARKDSTKRDDKKWDLQLRVQAAAS